MGDAEPNAVVPTIVGGVKRGVITAAVTGIVSGIVAALLSVWGLVQQLPGTVGIVPEGAVIAFASPEGCPAGWVDYKEAWGRFVVGAVEPEKIGEIPGEFLRDARGVDLTPKKYGKPGGEEKHLLTIPEMPSHTHEYSSEWGVDGNRSGHQDATYGRMTGQTSPSGGNEPHNVLPPYVALYYCKKS